MYTTADLIGYGLFVSLSTLIIEKIVQAIKKQKKIQKQEIANKESEKVHIEFSEFKKEFDLNSFISKAMQVLPNSQLISAPDYEVGDEVYFDIFNLNNSFNSWDSGGDILRVINKKPLEFTQKFKVSSIKLEPRIPITKEDDYYEQGFHYSYLIKSFFTAPTSITLGEIFKRVFNTDNAKTLFHYATILDESPIKYGIYHKSFIKDNTSMSDLHLKRLEKEIQKNKLRQDIIKIENEINQLMM